VADSATVAEGGTVTVLASAATSVLANDTDAENDALTAVLVSGPSNGSLTLNADGTFSYTHDGSETTSDSFTYKANDGTEDGNTVTVAITVTPGPDIISFAILDIDHPDENEYGPDNLSPGPPDNSRLFAIVGDGDQQLETAETAFRLGNNTAGQLLANNTGSDSDPVLVSGNGGNGAVTFDNNGFGVDENGNNITDSYVNGGESVTFQLTGAFKLTAVSFTVNVNGTTGQDVTIDVDGDISGGYSFGLVADGITVEIDFANQSIKVNGVEQNPSWKADFFADAAATPDTITIGSTSANGFAIQDLQLHRAVNTDPIILDLGDPGIDLSYSVAFDLNADGQLDNLAWTGGQDGILAMDLDQSGAIENGTEVFSPYFDQGGYTNALTALASLDSNGDGVIDSADPAFADLLVWQDQNHNGRSETGELKSLADLGIASISLNATASTGTIDGQALLGQGTFTYTGGESGDYVLVALSQTSASATNKLDYSRETGSRGVIANLSNSMVQADIGYGLVMAAAMTTVLDASGNSQALPAGIQEVVGTDQSDALFAGATGITFDARGGDDNLHGSMAADILIGGAGDDRIAGGGGADTIAGGSGTDTVDYSESASAVSVNLDDSGDASGTPAGFASPADGEIGGGFAEATRLSGIENIIGSSHDDVLIGNAVANLLDGGAGNDVLRGEGGDDALIGGDGRDTLEGGQGADIFIIDQAAFNDASLNGVADLIADYQQGVDVVDLRAALDLGFDLATADASQLQVLTQDYVRYISTIDSDPAASVPGHPEAQIGELWVDADGSGVGADFVKVADIHSFGGGTAPVDILAKIDDASNDTAYVTIT
jgi:VCBS repeat-containing protein